MAGLKPDAVVIVATIRALKLHGGAGKDQLTGENLTDENILGQPETCPAQTFTLDGFSEKCNYTVPPYSVTVLRLPQG